jgi:hypothetical protein
MATTPGASCAMTWSNCWVLRGFISSSGRRGYFPKPRARARLASYPKYPTPPEQQTNATTISMYASPCKLRLQSETCDRSGWRWLHRHHLGGGEAEHLHHVHLGLRHRQHGQPLFLTASATVRFAGVALLLGFTSRFPSPGVPAGSFVLPKVGVWPPSQFESRRHGRMARQTVS